jgi:putative ABC transport system permease protein
METLFGDVRLAIRMWLRSPGFAAVAILTLALGIGANTTMFSVVNATLRRPLPFAEPDRLVTIWTGSITDPDDVSIVSQPAYLDFATRNHSFASVAIFDSAGRGYNLSGGGEPEQVSGLRVTASFFAVLGAQPLLGRTFLPEEEEAGRDRIVVLSHGLWTRRYRADPGIVGKTIQIDGGGYTVVGVMPATFAFQFWSDPRQLWVPAGWTKGDRERGSHSFVSIGRLKPGVTIADARSDMDVIGRALAAAYPQDSAGETLRVRPMSEDGLQGLRVPLYTMLGFVGFVLLIACVNVANLMLARAATRRRELAVRLALGAGRGRLVRQLLTESVVLAAAGGVAGLTIAAWGTALFPTLLPNYLKGLPLRPVERIDIDASVLVFTTAVSLLSGVLFGLAPAFAFLRGGVNHPLKEQARGSTGGKSRLRYALVAAEVALTLVVLAGAGVMVLSVARLLRVNPGLDASNVLVMAMSQAQENLYYSPPEHLRFCDDLDQRVGAVPGVVSVSAIAHLPLAGGTAGRGLMIEGRPDPGPENQPGAAYTVACPNILKTMGITLAAGREFTLRDSVEAPRVAIVNEAMAKRHWPGEDAVGKRFRVDPYRDTQGPWITIVGVYKNIRQGSLDSEPRPMFMRPYSQAGWPFLHIVTRTASTPATFIAPIQRALAEVEPNQPVSGVRTMEDVVGMSVASRRFPMMLLSGFAIIALLLASVGIAGVVGYSVIQRTPEIGLRIALGAQSRDVLRLVLGHSLWWTLLGVAIGLLSSIGLLRLLGTLLYGVTASDPLVLGTVSLLLIVVAMSASYVPARRAMRVDPMKALRND